MCVYSDSTRSINSVRTFLTVFIGREWCESPSIHQELLTMEEQLPTKNSLVICGSTRHESADFIPNISAKASMHA
jgi:hypothetical protein